MRDCTAQNFDGSALLAERMLNDFNSRWGTTTAPAGTARRGIGYRQIGLPKCILVAAALDPRFKSLMGIREEDQSLVWDLVKTECLNCFPTPAAASASGSSSNDLTTSIASACSSDEAALHSSSDAMRMFDDLMNTDCNEAARLSIDELIDDDIKRYRSEPNLGPFFKDGEKFRLENPLLW